MRMRTLAPGLAFAAALALAGCGMGDYGRHMQEGGRVGAGGDPGPQLAQPGTLTRDDVLDMDTARATRDAEQAAFEARRAGFQPVAPTALPARPGDTTNIVAFALSTTHRVGEQRYRRFPISLRSTARNCAAFASADLAQEEFLRRGGPERDPLNLDPDGDGFACGWSPMPFRAAARVRD
ncbi:MAG: hypothetical protein ACXIU8_09950 [Alkalilacustris sp.]